MTATLENGRIAIESTTAGESNLSVQLKANNEQDGTLDFGTLTGQRPEDSVSSPREGCRDTGDNTTVKRSTNEFSDTIQGLAINLKKADSTSEVVVTVTRDTSALKTKIENFVKSYNSVVDFVDANSVYDKEKDTTGPLNGELTSRTVLQRLRDALQQSFNVDGYDTPGFSRWALNSIRMDGWESIRPSLTMSWKTMSMRCPAVHCVPHLHRERYRFFLQFGQDETRQLYRQSDNRGRTASVQSSSLADGVSSSGTLTITDNLGASLSIDVAEGDTATDIANTLNTEAAKTKKKYCVPPPP